MRSNGMLCDIHREQIKYFCSAQACYYMPLCNSCVEEHKSTHNKLELIPTKKAFQIAETNLLKQENQLEKILSPLKTRETMLKTIKQQQQDLENQKVRLIQIITEKIDYEIRLLDSSNQGELTNDEVNIKRTLELKLQQIDNLSPPNFEGKLSLLRKALNFQTKSFMDDVKGRLSLTLQSNRNIKSRKYKLFSNTHHQLMISPLELRERAHEKTKQIKKVMNESPLYFLIDQSPNSSNHLYSMCPEQRKLFAYNIDYEDWTTFHVPTQVSIQAAAVHDHKNNRFYWIGGVEQTDSKNQEWGQGNNAENSFSFGGGYRSEELIEGGSRRSDRILVYEPDNRERPWRYLNCRLRTSRSSCQAVLIEDKDDPRNKGIVISGGLGPNGQVLKSSEFLDLRSEDVISLEDTNFGAFAGTLVCYNQTNVLRIGGLYKNKADVAVVEVVQRLDCTQWIRSRGRIPRWSYVELLVPEFERGEKAALFNANQAAIQINPNEIFVFGGLTSGLVGSSDSFILGIQEFEVQTRGVRFDPHNRGANRSNLREERTVKQFKFTVRWVNEKPLISGDDFSGQCASIWKGKLNILQNTGSEDMVNFQKRLLCFNMYEWSEIEDVLPQ